MQTEYPGIVKHPSGTSRPRRRAARTQRVRVDPGERDGSAMRAVAELVFPLVLADSGGDTATGSTIGGSLEAGEEAMKHAKAFVSREGTRRRAFAMAGPSIGHPFSRRFKGDMR